MNLFGFYCVYSAAEVGGRSAGVAMSGDRATWVADASGAMESSALLRGRNRKALGVHKKTAYTFGNSSELVN